MLINRKEKLVLIHTAKRKLGLDDVAYRALLEGAAKVSSAADIEHEGQFRLIMEAFRNLGFVSTAAAKAETRKPRELVRVPDIKAEARPDHDDWWRCTPHQRAKIESLWALVSRVPGEQSLRRMASRICKIDAMPWIDSYKATKVILALRAMAVAAGYDPDTGEKPLSCS